MLRDLLEDWYSIVALPTIRNSSRQMQGVDKAGTDPLLAAGFSEVPEVKYGIVAVS